MRYASPDDIARGYITGGLVHAVRPPSWERSVRWLRPVDLVGVVAARAGVRRGQDLTVFDWRTALRIRAYRRYVRERFGVLWTHLDITAARKAVGDNVWRGYTTFSIVRDPWDRMISFYSWRTKRLPERPAFHDFVKAIWSGDQLRIDRYRARGYSNAPFLFEGGDLAVDRVVRFEHLRGDLTLLCEQTGIPFDGWLPHNKSGVRIPDIDYDEDTVGMVGEIEQDVVEHFGYDWDRSRVNPARAVEG